MAQDQPYRCLQNDEIETLARQGCEADDWSAVRVADPFDPSRVHRVCFRGPVQIGRLRDDGEANDANGESSRLEGVTLINCRLGECVRIVNVGRHIANYRIEDRVVIEHVGEISADDEAAFGNGIEVSVLNEAGGREVILFDRLDSQFAHMMCLHRWAGPRIESLQRIARLEAEHARHDGAVIGAGAVIRHVGRIENVRIGESARIVGAKALVNGSVLSASDAPTCVGDDVQAENFIIAEGSRVDGGALVADSFVGQGCRIGKQFSCEGSLFFANCEGFHGEACSVFAGPYTVTHHKSTLLIAGWFSFYNAGSGTNQSNHLYKLGPAHEGKLERGCKTGSFSYLMWPCRIGPFSVVLGKHTRTFDTADYPFSYLEAMPDGRCLMTPGFNLTTVGTVRDGQKWPQRDRRPQSARRDRITFSVFSPLTVGRMLRAVRQMDELRQNTDRAVDLVNISGTLVKRVLLRTAMRFYEMAIDMYLLGQLADRLQSWSDAADGPLASVLKPHDEATFSESWVDVGGLLLPQARLDELDQQLASGQIESLEQLNALLDQFRDLATEDEWAWACWAYRQRTGTPFDGLSVDQLHGALDQYVHVRTRFLKAVLSDATKEFDAAIQTGFGQDGREDDRERDFQAVRGELDKNSFVCQLRAEIERLPEEVESLKAAVARA